MIRLTRLNGEEIVVNAGLIEYVEATPDTHLTLVTGRKLTVRETVDELIDRSVEYHSRIGHPTVYTQPDDEDEAKA